jgi:hypothetical protein
MVELGRYFWHCVYSTFQRGLSSIAIVRGAEILIFDTGEGMQLKYMIKIGNE